ncbi:growth arrest and DNA damage-inducible proteins-interacting protein 1 [Nilaparvata lugens]|uniref:growth arrest and DNA damage-inducible proteins-interacting protein 1 n=1 Tax=Nilaparvata lugens TaxID=108931 RepID=UPI00193E6EFC|nr:growth arrest and DNA damage-inducible proteins-interacting protein 1 [Nilaparvata lugens]
MALLFESKVSKFKGILSVFQCSSVKLLSNDAAVANVATEPAEDEHELARREREEMIERKRNVSRLTAPHRNIVNDQLPYPEPQAKFHLSVKYRRRMYGRYGSASGVEPGVMWPTVKDIEERSEYESLKYPHTIQEMVKSQVNAILEAEDTIAKRQQKIAANMKKLEQWKKELNAKREHKLKAAMAERQNKERLIEEVRRHFGYTVDPREERFQEMLEKKEKEERRTAREQRKQLREEKYLEELMAKSDKKDAKK